MKTFKELFEARKPKLGCIIAYGRSRTNRWIGTVEELTSAFSYTLEVGASYSHEKGNKKINLKPKTVKALAKELEKSLHNSGNSGSYDYDDVTDEEYKQYEIEGSFSETL